LGRIKPSGGHDPNGAGPTPQEYCNRATPDTAKIEPVCNGATPRLAPISLGFGSSITISGLGSPRTICASRPFLGIETGLGGRHDKAGRTLTLDQAGCAAVACPLDHLIPKHAFTQEGPEKVSSSAGPVGSWRNASSAANRHRSKPYGPVAPWSGPPSSRRKRGQPRRLTPCPMPRISSDPTRNRARHGRGTESSNPASSSGESVTNLISPCRSAASRSVFARRCSRDTATLDAWIT
jgi:hypothetical protein